MMNSCNLVNEFENPIQLLEIERSLEKKFRKELLRPFIKAIQDFNLIEENDKIAIAISGGKDSLVLAKLFQQLKRHNKFNFELEFIAMDPGFNQINFDLLIKNCEYLNIPIKIYKSDIFKITNKIAYLNPCYMCARMRRGFLYSKAKELGCNKLALGHHFDDVIETTMLNILYAGEFKTMVPKIKSENFEDIDLIRPMVYIKEKDIMTWKNYSNIITMDCGCEVEAKKFSSKRREVKELLNNLSKNNQNILDSIFSSATNVNIDAVYGYSKLGEKFDFNDIYLNNVKGGVKDE